MSAARTVLRVRARIGTDRAHDLTAEIASGVTLGAFADAPEAAFETTLVVMRHTDDGIEERELTSTAPTSDFALYQALPLMLTFEDR